MPSPVYSVSVLLPIIREHLALVQVLAPLAQSMALNSIVVPAECLRDMCKMLIQQIHCYTTSLSSEEHLKNAVASVSSLVQVYLHLYMVCVITSVYCISAFIKCVFVCMCV